ncbi:hypothetical protein D1007_45554 [Hordeum vulgare]|nr:hypothetical protein D1007_45554 [Hordeum vulgare]
MAPAGKKGKAMESSVSITAAGPALTTSHISKGEDPGLVLPILASDTNECGVTAIWPCSAAPSILVKSAYPFFLHSIYARLVPLFSDFFYAILSYY